MDHNYVVPPRILQEHDYVFPARILQEQKTLRYILSTKFPNGMPEETIAVVLKSTLKGINGIQTRYGDRPEVNAGRIYLDWDIWEICHDPQCIRLAYHKDHTHTGDGPQVGIWGAGIVALELAYGSLPANVSAQQLVTMANNLMRILGQKMGNAQKRIKKLPNTLQMLLDDEYVSRREQKLMAKRNAKGIRLGKMVLEDSFRSLPMVETHQKKSFSWDFLVMVMRCLNRDEPSPINQILELPFFENA